MIFKKKFRIDYDNLPKHIGIIMDGNGRWAHRRGLPRSAGHAAGAENFKRIVTFCGKIGISCLTVYAFSTENWKRSQEEISSLMKLLDEYLKRAYAELEGKNVKVKIIGERDMLDENILKSIEALEKHTKKNTGLELNIALSYGGRQEIINSARRVAELAVSGKLDPADIDEAYFSSLMYTSGQPDPDLIIRPSGEMRLSNFLVWQSAYSEFWFSKVMWPSFSENQMIRAIAVYQKRNRRFGGR